MRPISVTKDAISSQAYIIEEDGAVLHRVNVQISKNNSVAVQIDILPKRPVDVTARALSSILTLQSEMLAIDVDLVSLSISLKPSSFSPKMKKGCVFVSVKELCQNQRL